MPVSNFNVGRDQQVVVLHPMAPNGVQLDLLIVTAFDDKENRKKITVAALNGLTSTGYVPESYDLSIETERGNAEMDTFMSNLDAQYRAGVNIPYGQVYRYVQELNGSQSIFFYDKVAFTRGDGGKWMQDSAVKQTLMGTAMTKQKVA